MQVKCGNHNEPTYHASAQEVRACYGAQAIDRINAKQVNPPQAYPIATDKQVEFVESLLRDRVATSDTDLAWGGQLNASLGVGAPGDYHYVPRTLGKRDASTAIARLQGWTRKPRTAVQAGVAAYVDANWPDDVPLPAPGAVATVTQDGMYRNPVTGEIFKVQWNKASGNGARLYAKRLILWVDGKLFTAPSAMTAKLQATNRVIVEFQYAPGKVQELKPEWRMTLAEAREFGALYGTCVRCGRTLTAEDSIERMMGPVCAGKGNWA